jgi:hypothetical protein
MEPQSRELLIELWKKHIEPLNKLNHGGAILKGFYYLDELPDVPPLTKRGETIFVLHPRETRENGHWTVLTKKSRAVIYFDPMYRENGIPDEVAEYLRGSKSDAIIEQASPQSQYEPGSIAIKSCGLFCIKYLKQHYT